MDYETLKSDIALGLTQRDIAHARGTSQTNVRYWLRKYNLKTKYDKGPVLASKPIPEGYPMHPTADDYAVAIVTAARLTGEDPIAIAQGKNVSKARHYALHALIYWFPQTDRTGLVNRLGSSGDRFYRNSCRLVADPNGHSSYTVMWWDPRIYEAVKVAIDAARLPELKIKLGSRRKVDVRTVRQVRADNPLHRGRGPRKRGGETLRTGDHPTGLPPKTRQRARPAQKTPALGKLEPEGYRPPPGTIKAVLEDDEPVIDIKPIFDRGRFAEPKPRERPISTKADLYAELRKAVENTARMQKSENE